MSRWTFEQDAYLANHFANATMQDMIAATGRTKDAIYYRAKMLELRRKNHGRIGHGRFLAGTPFRPGSLPPKTNICDAVIEELATHTERTIHQFRAVIAARSSTIWKACDRLKKQNNIHITRFQEVEGSRGNWEAVYRIGAGEDAIRPKAGSAPEPVSTIPHAIPRPQLGAWGCSW